MISYDWAQRILYNKSDNQCLCIFHCEFVRTPLLLCSSRQDINKLTTQSALSPPPRQARLGCLILSRHTAAHPESRSGLASISWPGLVLSGRQNQLPARRAPCVLVREACALLSLRCGTIRAVCLRACGLDRLCVCFVIFALASWSPT
jgi:hypothetical protein